MMIELVAPESLAVLSRLFGSRALASAEERLSLARLAADARMQRQVERYGGVVAKDQIMLRDDRELRDLDRLMRQRASGELGSRV
jgi:hypothetical protein